MLSREEKEHFITQGWIVIGEKRGVSKLKVENCLRGINHALGKPNSLSEGGAQKRMGKLDGFSQSLTNTLMQGEGSAQWIYEAFAKDPKGTTPENFKAQLALRFPERPDSLYELLHVADLVDKGAAWHTDGLRQGRQHPFSLLLGVCLSDTQEEFMGNLLLWPTKHSLIHSCLTESNKHGFDVDKLCALLDEKISSLEKNEVKVDGHDNMPALPSLGKPHTVLLKKGDVICVHPDLPHSGGPNWGADIRIMVYFRLTFSTDVAQHRLDMLHDFHHSFAETRDETTRRLKKE